MSNNRNLVVGTLVVLGIGWWIKSKAEKVAAAAAAARPDPFAPTVNGLGYVGMSDSGLGLSFKDVKKKAKKAVKSVGKTVSDPIKKVVKQIPVVNKIAAATANTLKKVDSKVLRPVFKTHTKLMNEWGPKTGIKLTHAVLGITKSPSGGGGGGASAVEEGPSQLPGTYDYIKYGVDAQGNPLPELAQETGWTDNQAQDFQPDGGDPSEAETLEPYEEAEVIQDDQEGSNSLPFLVALDADIRQLTGGG